VRLAAGAAACLVLAACGGDDGPDVEEVESGLVGVVEETTGTRDVAVSCPDDVGEGDVCEVTAPGGVRAQVRVTRIDDSDVDGEVVQP
jgi:hypothetical protein